MIVCGVDPGTGHCGWAVLHDGLYHTSGTLAPRRTLSTLDRHLWLLSKLQDVLKDFHPTILSFEEFMWRSRDDEQTRYVTGRPAMERLIGGIQTLTLYPPFPVLYPLLPSRWGRQLCGHASHTKAQIAFAVNARLGTRFKGDARDNHEADSCGVALVAYDLLTAQAHRDAASKAMEAR